MLVIPAEEAPGQSHLYSEFQGSRSFTVRPCLKQSLQNKISNEKLVVILWLLNSMYQTYNNTY